MDPASPSQDSAAAVESMVLDKDEGEEEVGAVEDVEMRRVDAPEGGAVDDVEMRSVNAPGGGAVEDVEMRSVNAPGGGAVEDVEMRSVNAPGGGASGDDGADAPGEGPATRKGVKLSPKFKKLAKLVSVVITKFPREELSNYRPMSDLVKEAKAKKRAKVEAEAKERARLEEELEMRNRELTEAALWKAYEYNEKAFDSEGYKGSDDSPIRHPRVIVTRSMGRVLDTQEEDSGLDTSPIPKAKRTKRKRWIVESSEEELPSSVGSVFVQARHEKKRPVYKVLPRPVYKVAPVSPPFSEIGAYSSDDGARKSDIENFPQEAGRELDLDEIDEAGFSREETMAAARLSRMDANDLRMPQRAGGPSREAGAREAAFVESSGVVSAPPVAGGSGSSAAQASSSGGGVGAPPSSPGVGGLAAPPPSQPPIAILANEEDDDEGEEEGEEQQVDELDPTQPVRGSRIDKGKGRAYWW